MNLDAKFAWKTGGLIVRVVLMLTIAFLAMMAYHAYVSSHQVGAGAAQGDLGFLFVLMITTPFILAITVFSLWVDRAAMRATFSAKSASWLVVLLCALNIIALAWNWFFLEVLWTR